MPVNNDNLGESAKVRDVSLGLTSASTIQALLTAPSFASVKLRQIKVTALSTVTTGSGGVLRFLINSGSGGLKSANTIRGISGSSNFNVSGTLSALANKGFFNISAVSGLDTLKPGETLWCSKGTAAAATKYAVSVHYENVDQF